MSRIETRPDHALLTQVLSAPERLSQLTPSQFGRLLTAAHDARLLGWLLTHAAQFGVPVNPPVWLQDRLTGAKGLAAEYDRSIRWEIDRLDRAFAGTNVAWVLLKGAAYFAASLQAGQGRRVADIDVLVPREMLHEAETALKSHGWAFGEKTDYDDRYYREWMHELPPMIHGERMAVVDVHHAILPRTSRLQPSSARLIEQAILLETGARVLSPAHMVLHAAAHLFHDGEIAGAIRDLVDLDSLIREFGRRETFWTELDREARELELRRPAYYAIRYAQRMFGTPVPTEVIRNLGAWAPPRPVRALMDSLVMNAIPGPTGRASSAAALALYIRSHWLRMPPLLLVRHLATKATRKR